MGRGSTTLVHRGELLGKVEDNDDGINVLGTSSQTIIELQDDADTSLAKIGVFSGSGNLEIRSLQHGNPITMRAEDSGGTTRFIFSCDPDGGAVFYYNGSEKFRTLSNGIRVTGTTIDLTSQPGTYTPTNVTTDRSYDANATTTDELADVLGSLIADLQTIGLIG